MINDQGAAKGASWVIAFLMVWVIVALVWAWIS